jgi:hypothetical protein
MLKRIRSMLSKFTRRETSLLMAAMTLLLLAGLAPNAVLADDWPQWLGPKRDGVWPERGILERFPPVGPKVH